MEEKNKDSGRNLSSGLSKNDIISILEHDSFLRTVNQFLQHSKKTQYWKTISFIVMAILGIFGFYLAWASNFEASKIETIRLRNERETARLDHIIQTKISWMRNVDESVTDLRKTRQNIILRCKYDKPLSLYEQQLLRSNARFDVNKAFTGVEYIFDQQVHQKLHDFLSFDESIKDVCASDAPTDAEYIDHLHQFTNLMGASILQDAKDYEKN